MFLLLAFLLWILFAGCCSQDGKFEGSEEELAWINLYNKVNGSSKPKLKMDTAWLTFNVTIGFNLQIHTQEEDCWKCPLQQVGEVDSQNISTIVVKTIHPMRIGLLKKINTQNVESICNFTYKFKEHGDYWLFFNYTSYYDGLCHLLLANDPPNSELPILYAFAGLLGLAILWTLISFIYRNDRLYSCCSKLQKMKVSEQQPQENSYSTIVLENQEKDVVKEDEEKEKTQNVAASSEVAKTPEVKKERKRLRSLDTLRGISIIIMIFVNYGGGGYWFFEHAQWNGLTLADLVFPWFIFIMGTSMNFSFRSLIRRKTPRLKIFRKIMSRSLKLFALGIWLNSAWGPVVLQNYRIPGVLQRFAITYLILAMMELFSARAQDSHQDRKWALFRDILLYWPEWVINLLMLALHLGITFGLPVPSCPIGYNGPGGISEGGKYYNCTGGAAQYVDSLVFGNSHIYQHPTVKEMYKTDVPFDPEGLLGVLTSVFLCFLGLQAGRIIITYESHKERVARWIIWSLITGAIATALCGASQNDGIIPINKNLWSVSFVFINGSFAFFLLAILYVFIDILGWWSGDPFVYPGMNSIVVYCGHNIFWNYFPINWHVEPGHWQHLLQDLWGTAIWIIVAYIMFWKKIFVAL